MTFSRGSLVRVKRSKLRSRVAPTLQPHRPVCMVTSQEGAMFRGVVITGHFSGDVIHEYCVDFEMLPVEALITVQQPNHAKRPGDIVVNDEGLHVAVSSVSTVKDNKLFAGFVVIKTDDHYTWEFSQHWKDEDFRVSRRREDLEYEATSKPESITEVVRRLGLANKTKSQDADLESDITQF